jgi:hypothetical protein
MPNDYDALSKRIRRKVYSSTEELKKDFAEGLAAIARQPSVDRGLENQTIADVQGGTTLGVGDTAATQVSDVLVQNPQPGLPKNVGSGLLTRRQSRIRSDTRVLAAKVLADAGPGDTEVSVMIVGATPVKGRDDQTGIQVVADASGGLQDSVGTIEGKQMMAKMTGQPIVTAGSTGIQPLTAGQTVHVAVTTQHEDTTTWTTRSRKNKPTVVSVQKVETAALVNGLACAGSGICVILLEAPADETFSDQNYPDGSDWVFVSPFDAQHAGQPWAVFVLGPEPSGTLDRNNGDYSYYDFGVVGPAGEVTFTGIPWSVVFGTNQFSEVNGDPMAQVWKYFLVKGCAVGQSVNFGSVSLNYSWSDPSIHRNWNLIDTDFPIPL